MPVGLASVLGIVRLVELVGLVSELVVVGLVVASGESPIVLVKLVELGSVLLMVDVEGVLSEDVPSDEVPSDEVPSDDLPSDEVVDGEASNDDEVGLSVLVVLSEDVLERLLPPMPALELSINGLGVANVVGV